METLIIFIGLKIVEIIGVCVICYVAMKLADWFLPVSKNDRWIWRVIAGLVGLIIAFFAGLLFYELVIANWEWAVRLTN